MTPAENRRRLAILRSAPTPGRGGPSKTDVEEVVSVGGKRNRTSSVRRFDVLSGVKLG